MLVIFAALIIKVEYDERIDSKRRRGDALFLGQGGVVCETATGVLPRSQTTFQYAIHLRAFTRGEGVFIA
jgi:hypothetical protein